MEGQSSFRGAYSGTDFDLIEFLKRPKTICRLLCAIFAIVVFGCIFDEGFVPPYGHCAFNKNQYACHYGIAIGMLAFFACLLFLAVDTQFNKISNSQTRKHLVTANLVFSAIWSFLWFVGFCFLTDQWRKSNVLMNGKTTDNARAAIAFSFFSIFTWAALTLMAYQRYHQGESLVSHSHTTSNEYGVVSNNDYKPSPYASFPHPGEEDSINSYQQQPFGVPDQPFGVPPQQPVKTEYSVPEY